MSIYGALFAGVGGLKAQGTKIGIISDNIANVNTVGYKATKAAFETLVVNTGSNVSYAPGGVIANNVQLVDKQGILTATDAPTDIAMSGSGFFAVNAQPDGVGEPLYTRAGAFRQDSLGNFVNPNGFYLQGWPLDREGRLPGEPGNLNQTSAANLDSLETVNVESQSGVVSGTTQVSMGANLDAGEGVFPGSGVDVVMDINNAINYGIAADDVIVPDTYIVADGGAGVNGIAKGDQMTVETGNGLSYVFTYDGFTASRSVNNGNAGELGAANAGPANIFDANSPTESFFGNTGLAGFTTAARSFTIETGAGGTKTFTYVTSSPNAILGEFSNMNNLATAINEAAGLTARVEDGRLYIAPEDANDFMTFANVDDTSVGPPAGIDWVSELDVANVTVGNDRFNSLKSLYDLVESSDGISAVLSNPLSDANLSIVSDDPLDTISFFDGPDNAGTGNAGGSLLVEFGLSSSPFFADGNGDGDNDPTTISSNNSVANIDPSYDTAGVSGQNMASGDITAHFSRNVRVYDSLGAGHDLRISYLKVGENRWAVEVHAIPENDINGLLVDGQVATGTLTFNGDGSLRSVSTGLTNEVAITWTNGATASNIDFNWGTAGLPFGTGGAAQIGLTDGLSQFSSDYNVAFVNQNGAPVGELIGVTINEEGDVIASYSNGETQALYRLPVADFSNPNGLRARSGNVYSQTQESGEVNFREAGSNGTGTVVSAALESSNVELAEELTDMIVAQRAYQASAKVISTSDELLEELNRL